MIRSSFRVLLMAFAFSTALYSETVEPTHNYQVIAFQDLTDSSLKDLMEGHLPNLVVSCEAGTEFAINFFAYGSIFASDNPDYSPSTLSLERSFYFRHDGKELLFSWNQDSWKGFHDFFSGSLSFSLSVSNCRPVVEFHLDLND